MRLLSSIVAMAELVVQCRQQRFRQGPRPLIESSDLPETERAAADTDAWTTSGADVGKVYGLPTHGGNG